MVLSPATLLKQIIANPNHVLACHFPDSIMNIMTLDLDVITDNLY